MEIPTKHNSLYLSRLYLFSHCSLGWRTQVESISSTLVSTQLFDLIEINFRILFVCQRDVCACVCFMDFCFVCFFSLFFFL